MRERAGHFADGRQAGGFRETWAWAGDQGLMLGNLSDAMMHLAPNFRGPLLERIAKLIAGVGLNLVDIDDVLQSFTGGSAPDGDYDDYQTGSGVFWRNALYAWNTDADLRSIFAGKPFQTLLRASAEAAARKPIGSAGFDDLANDVAVLVAAMVMLP